MAGSDQHLEEALGFVERVMGTGCTMTSAGQALIVAEITRLTAERDAARDSLRRLRAGMSVEEEPGRGEEAEGA